MIIFITYLIVTISQMYAVSFLVTRIEPCKQKRHRQTKLSESNSALKLTCDCDSVNPVTQAIFSASCKLGFINVNQLSFKSPRYSWRVEQTLEVSKQQL